MGRAVLGDRCLCFTGAVILPSHWSTTIWWPERTFVDIDGIPQPAPAPRFSRTPATIPPGIGITRPGRRRPRCTGILEGLGYSEAEIGMLREERAVR